MARHRGIQADMFAGEGGELLHLDLLARGSELCHWVQLKHRRPQNPPL